MRGIHRHYANVATELTPAAGRWPVTLPSRNVSIVLISKLHLPTLRALAYARATRPGTGWRRSRSTSTTTRPRG